MILFAYNRQRHVTSVTDQAGTVHAYDYDKLGRQTQDRVTTLGTGVDGAVRRIETGYEVRGMKARITSYDNPTVGSGTVLNESTFAYNNYGQVTSEFQAHAGTVNVATSPKVQYAYANGSANTIRPTGMTYPNGRVVTYDYGTTNSAADKQSRIAAIKEGSATLASYSYLGRQTFVEQDNPEPDVRWTLVDLAGSNDPDTGDIYAGLDRFGRVKDHRWRNDGSSTDIDRIQYGYDRAGNRVWRKNPVADALGKRYDEVYGYDAAQRLKTMDRGTLAGSSLTNPTFAQCWSLDPTGNWKGFREDADGNGTWDLVQSRTANGVNEITDITNTTGTAWIDPAYNRAGNMATMPRPNDPTQSYTATYDAWNRLVKLVDSSTGQTVQEHQYDARTFRVVRQDYTAGSLTETRRFYYTPGWRCVEERVGTSTSAERQHVWGLRYIDELVLRDRDTDGNGALDERLYACQDANWNVVAIVDNSGDVQERYVYAPYGQLASLTPSLVSRASSSFGWETTYAGYRLDVTSEIYSVRYRTFHSTTGTWTITDPIRYRHGTNLYAYAVSVPTLFTDPFGLEINLCICSVSSGGAGLGGGGGAGGHTWQTFTFDSCETVCCGRHQTPAVHCDGRSREIPPDIARVIGHCGGNRTCEAELVQLLNQVDRVSPYPNGRATPNTASFIGPYYDWLRSFLRNYPQYDGQPITLGPPGNPVIELQPLTFQVPDELLVDTFFYENPVYPLHYSLAGLVVNGFSDHGVVAVTFFPHDPVPIVEYFDAGSQFGTSGEFGGADHWFSTTSNRDFCCLLDQSSATPFPRP